MCYYIIVSPIRIYTGETVVQSSLPCEVSLRVHFIILTITKIPHWIASTFDMYIDVDDNITETQDGSSLEIDGPPIIAKKINVCTL